MRCRACVCAWGTNVLYRPRNREDEDKCNELGDDEGRVHDGRIVVGEDTAQEEDKKDRGFEGHVQEEVPLERMGEKKSEEKGPVARRL